MFLLAALAFTLGAARLQTKAAVKPSGVGRGVAVTSTLPKSSFSRRIQLHSRKGLSSATQLVSSPLLHSKGQSLAPVSTFTTPIASSPRPENSKAPAAAQPHVAVAAEMPQMTLKDRLLAFRRNNRQVLGEFIGTFTLMFLGTAVNCVAGMGAINLVGVAIGWAFAIAMAVYVSGGVSDAHLNPAVTLTFALFKGFKWKMVIPYWIAQFLGAFAGSGLAFLDHKSGLDAFDAMNGVVRATTGAGATAGIFATYPAAHVGVAHAFFDEVLTTASLLMCVFALSDSKNMSPKGNVGPVIVGGLVALLILGFGGITGVAMNPARDLAPRIMTFLAGWGSEVFTAGNHYWWIPIVAPLIGGPLGGAIYNTFVDQPAENEKEVAASS